MEIDSVKDTHLRTPRKRAVDAITLLLGLPLLFIVIVFVLIPFIRSLCEVPERPTFSDGFRRNGIMSHWMPPVFFPDEAGNYCTMDVQLNSVLVVRQKVPDPAFHVMPLPHGYFEITFRSDAATQSSPLQSKSIHFAGWEDTAIIVSDDLTFTVTHLQPETATMMKAAVQHALSTGKKVPDFVAYLQERKDIKEKH